MLFCHVVRIIVSGQTQLYYSLSDQEHLLVQLFHYFVQLLLQLISSN